ncbi:vWA domain-containing protein [Nocardia cyriacigeorgica]|uniref:vWA domain-containing protein n=1 Tax=Nocardia cyriacigeorgica TaxID=135487 RepID=UPI0024589C44|nr:VWA domain-containing protein [Nocardia cyriacigeorgica]
MSFLTKVTGLAAAGMIGLVPVATPALAQQSPQQTQYAPTMLVLDASGSMLAPDPSGGTKMDAAKTAVRTFVASAPDASRVGLTVYGTETGNSDAEKDAGCRDVRVLEPAEAIDKSALTSAVDQIAPRGYTPIGTSLRTANDALPDEGPKSIVLVSDGLDTCTPPDPCEVARELEAQGTDLVVHAIGFGVDDPSRAQLTCIAQSTGGTYTDAVDGETLEQVLPRVSATALRNYAAAGIPIEGTDGYRDAPVAEPGQYLDVLGREKPRYYAVDVPEGATAYFSGTVSFPRGGEALFANNRLDLRVFGADGHDCHVYENELATRSADGVALTVGTVWEGATKPESDSPGTAECTGGGRYYFTLEWAHVADNAPAQLPIEISVGIEPAVTDPGAAADPTPVTFTAQDGPVVPVTGGGSFNVAATLPESGRYTDTLQRGEFVFYRVKLDWGQALAYRVRFAETPGRGSENISNIATTLYAPYREELDSDTTSYGGQEKTLPTNDPALATAPIRYLNREANGDIAKQAVAGWYYIAVKLSPAAGEGRAAGVPIELELDVSGEPEPGPQYREASGETFGNDKPVDRPGGDQTVAAADSGDDDGISPVVWVASALGVCVVAALGILVVLIRRRGTR